MVPSPTNATPHERAVLLRAAAQVESVIGYRRIESFLRSTQRNWPVAQLVERRAVNADVARSSRARSASLEFA